MLLSEIKEKVTRPSKFTSLAIAEGERLEREADSLREENNRLRLRCEEYKIALSSGPKGAFIHHLSSSWVMNKIHQMESYSTQLLTNYSEIRFLGLTSRGNSVFLKREGNFESINVFEGDVKGSIKKAQNPIMSYLQENNFSYKSHVSDQELLKRLNERFNIIVNEASKRTIDSINGNCLMNYSVNTSINNCGALLVMNLGHNDYKNEHIDFIESINYCLNHFQKYMAIGTDYEGGNFHHIISDLGASGELKCGVHYYIHRGESYENRNSGNDIYSFQIYM